MVEKPPAFFVCERFLKTDTYAPFRDSDCRIVTRPTSNPRDAAFKEGHDRCVRLRGKVVIDFQTRVRHRLRVSIVP